MRAEQLIRTEEELDAIEAQVLNAASRTVEALKRLLGEKQPLRAFAEMKFQMAGFHPTADRPLNLIEQINQTFTCWPHCVPLGGYCRGIQPRRRSGSI